MSAFERFGRKTAKEIGPPLLVCAAAIGFMALGGRVPSLTVAVWIFGVSIVAVAGAAALVIITAMLWAGIAPIGRRLCPYLPVRVWQVEGPLGSGPWLDKPAEAAGFIKDERQSNAYTKSPLLNKVERRAYRNAPDFTPAELKGLWFPGRKVERNGWSIQCRLILRHELDNEWDGW